MLCAGFIGGPNVISMFLRAGWSVGEVQDRYLKYSDRGDQQCGRVAAGLDFNDGPGFNLLFPKFESKDVLTDEEWNTALPNYRACHLPFQACIPYLLASPPYN